MDARNVTCRQSVKRKIPIYVRIVQVFLYLAVAVFTFIGTMLGTPWLIPALGTLIGTWYYMGQARVTYHYELEGTRFCVVRESGFLARPKKEDFLELRLENLTVMAREGDPCLTKAEAASAAASPKRITYDVSEHDVKNPPAVLYAMGSGRDSGRQVKVSLQPGEELWRCFRKLAGEKVHWNEDEQ